MITINPVKIKTIKTISFGRTTNSDNSRVGLMLLDKNSSNKIKFEKDLFITKNADSVQTNPLKAIGYSFVKAYNILSTPKRNTSPVNERYIHVPYMA